MSEHSIQNEIRLAASEYGCVLFRNNVGVLRDREGSYIRYGLAVGSSDLIGFVSIVGVAVFVAVECKAPGKRPTKKQAAFMAAVNAAGGIALSCDSVETFQERFVFLVAGITEKFR